MTAVDSVRGVKPGSRGAEELSSQDGAGAGSRGSQGLAALKRLWGASRMLPFTPTVVAHQQSKRSCINLIYMDVTQD